MKRLIGIAAVAALALALASPASADAIAFSGTSGGSGPTDVSFSGTIYAHMTGVDQWLVDSITGTQTQGSFTSLITGLSSYAGADQELFGPITALLPDFSGVSWKTASLGDFNWFTNGAQYQLAYTTDNVGYPQNGVLLTQSNANYVPEPMTLAILGTGLIGLGMMRRKQIPAA